MSDKREQLAEYAHEAWSGWMKYQFEKMTFRPVQHIDGSSEGMWVMPAWAVERWQRQMNTPYAELPESEKESDRKEADRMLAIINGVPATPPALGVSVRDNTQLRDQLGG